MKLIHFSDKKRLNDFVGKQQLCQFLQSWEWADLQKQLGNKVWLLGVEDNGKLIASALVILKQVMGFKYLYCPRGPIVETSSGPGASLEFLFTEINKLAKKQGAKFLRWEPIFELPINNWSMQPTIPVQPKSTIVLDLTASNDKLLANMHQKTRYNIRLAKKKGVVIEELSANQWPEVWPIMQQTKTRDAFSLHAKDYYQKLIDQPINKLLVAKYQDQAIALAIICVFGNTATYLHGGSANVHRNVMAPFLLQWQAIKYAKSAGCQHYDFNGIDEQKWPGVTRFKKGFNGQEINYLGTFDLIYSPVYYWIYKVARFVRRLI